ncbi:MAG: anti-sigma factor antagonist [Lachnospiraceae bacterium]|nr:anti-sigma factor antagonist [Lachnospiraceae bacterium]
MANLSAKSVNQMVNITFCERVNTDNAAEIEKELNNICEEYPRGKIIIDMKDLKYISSAGLRILLRLQKKRGKIKVINVSSEVYEIFSMTGFDEIMEVEKAYRTIDVTGCEIIGSGSNGNVYRINGDTIVKVYNNPEALDDIKKERELAKKAFVLGVPTAISYDVVRVGEGYGSVFELLESKSLSAIISEDPDNVEKYIDIFVDLLKKIHSISLKDDDIPNMKKRALGWVGFLEGQLPNKTWKKLRSLVEKIPDDNNLLHGDYHTKNVMVVEGEPMLIDMDTLCTGNPIFEFASIYNAFIGFNELDHEMSKDFLGLPFELSERVYNGSLKRFLTDVSQAEIEDASDKIKLIGQVRILRRCLRRLSNTEMGKKQIEISKNYIIELTEKIDSLNIKWRI